MPAEIRVKKAIVLIAILLGLMGLVYWSAQKPALKPVVVTDTNAAPVAAVPPAPEPVVTPPPAETKPAEPKPVVVAEPKPPVEIAPASPAPEKIVVTDIPKTNPPVAPKTYSTTPNLLPDVTAKDEQRFYRLRLGYEHAHFGGGEDTWRLGANAYFQPQTRRNELKGQTNGWVAALIPDIYAEAGHAAMASTAAAGTPVIGNGVQFDVGAFWPLLQWNNQISWMTNASPRMLHFSLGPTAHAGLQVMTSGTQHDGELSRYGGARLAAGPDAFIEYTAGKTDGLPALRQQVLAEFPIYQKADSELRYVFRGLWNSSYSQGKDILSASLLIEFPFDAVAHPSKFRDLVPFVK